MGANRRRLGTAEWRGLLDRFASSGMTAVAFCRRESVSLASFYRWRSLLGAGTPSRAMAAPAADSPTAIDFVDLGTLREAAAGQRIDLRLDLGGGLTLHLVRS